MQQSLTFVQKRRAALYDIVEVIDEVGFVPTIDNLQMFLEAEVKAAFTRGIKAAKTKPEGPAKQKREAA